jgi:hypothetical protein
MSLVDVDTPRGVLIRLVANEIMVTSLSGAQL